MCPRPRSPELRALTFRLLSVFAVLLCAAFAGTAQAQPSMGTVEGRVFEPATGAYLESVRITVEGTALETFTDADGNYRLYGVPAGTATIRAFRTGLPPSTSTVQVTAEATIQHPIQLGSYARGPDDTKPGDQVVKLGALVVQSRSMDGAAIAINEQRFASQMKSVVGADEFGMVAEANAGEFMKFLPGVAIEYGGGNARNVLLDGAPSNNVPVTVAGLDLASAGVGGMGRAVALDMVSINNISRIELVQSPTPESPGSALAGSVNMVPRSAFDRRKPEFNGSAYVMMRDSEHNCPRLWRDYRKTAYLNAGRGFNGPIPFQVKTGVDVRIGERDVTGGTMNYTYVGADGVAAPTPNTPVGNDNGAGPFLDESFSQRTPPWSFPPTDWLSADRIYQTYAAHPNYFTTNAVDAYNSYTNTSKDAEERITSAFIRFDAAFIDRRLKITTGLRGEQTNIDAYGPLNNPSGNLRKDANGNPIPGALIFPVNTVDARKLILTERGAHTQKEYLRYFPSLNLSYAITENLIARGAYYWSIGRPDYNQYAGGVTLPDLTVTPDPNAPAGRINVNNVGIKPWKAETFKVRLEYYFEKVGQVSIGGFRRNYTNFWRQQQITPTPEFYQNYGIDPETYGAYQFFTDVNQPGTYSLTGLQADYRQALTFLPHWARGVQVFANASIIHESGVVLGSTAFAGFIPRIYNWGVSLTRPKYNVRVNWNYRGLQRLNSVTNAGTEPGTYRYAIPRLYVDVLGEFNLTNHLALFFNLRNLNDALEKYETYGPHTPEYARLRNITDFHPLWTFGVKGRF